MPKLTEEQLNALKELPYWKTFDSSYCRVVIRARYNPDVNKNTYGFRVVRSKI